MTNNIVDELRSTKLNHGSDRCDPLPDQECGCGDIYIEQRLAQAADLIEQLDREQADIALACAERQAEIERVEAERDNLRAALRRVNSMIGEAITWEGGLHYVVNAYDLDDWREDNEAALREGDA